MVSSSLLAAAPAVAAAAAPVSGSHGDLSGLYRSFLAKEHPEHKVITYPRGHFVKASVAAAAACSEPTCPLIYYGGPVQHQPKVYLLLWGPSWSTSGSVASYLKAFYSGLGAQPQSSWSATMEQYTDATGHPSFTGSVLKGVFQDTSTPPTGTTQDQLAAEADAFYTNHGLADPTNSQIVIATPSGTCPQGFYAPTCSGGSGSYCAWHSNTSSNNVPYTNLPYLVDAGGTCGQGNVNSPGDYDGFSIVGGHEYAETVTDPYPDSGWSDASDSVSGGEVADKCAWSALDANVKLSTGSFAFQPLWSNSAQGCVMSTSAPVAGVSLTVSKSGTGSGTVSSSPSGINCGATCSTSYASGSAVTLTQNPGAGSTFTGWSGACTGLTTCTVHMTSAQKVTAAFRATPLPDLTVTGVTWSPPSPMPGNPVTFSATIKNVGTATTPAGVVDGVAFFIDGTPVTWSKTHTATLAPGTSITIKANTGTAGLASWTATSGAHTVLAKVDYGNLINEINGANNTLSKSVDIYRIVAPSVVTLSAGTRKAGTAASLAKADGVNYQANSTNAGTRTATWTATLASIPKTTAGLRLTYKVANSRSCTETLYIWNYATSSWTLLKTSTVGTSATTLTVVPSGTLGNYVSGASGGGSVKIEAKATNATAAFYTSGDQLRLEYL